MRAFWGYQWPKIRALWAHNSVKWVSQHTFTCVWSISHETQANWLVQGQCGPQRAYLWPNEGPLGPSEAPIEGHLVSNCCSMGHLPCIQMCLIHFSLKTSQLVGPRLGRAPNAVLEPSEGLLGWPIKHENGDFSKSVHANCFIELTRVKHVK